MNVQWCLGINQSKLTSSLLVIFSFALFTPNDNKFKRISRFFVFSCCFREQWLLLFELISKYMYNWQPKDCLKMKKNLPFFCLKIKIQFTFQSLLKGKNFPWGTGNFRNKFLTNMIQVIKNSFLISRFWPIEKLFHTFNKPLVELDSNHCHNP